MNHTDPNITPRLRKKPRWLLHTHVQWLKVGFGCAALLVFFMVLDIGAGEIFLMGDVLAEVAAVNPIAATAVTLAVVVPAIVVVMIDGHKRERLEQAMREIDRGP